uniref:Uncharacterized protein n=1 Tax=Arabidopsis thaliana TaxID=3702 RepID=Q0WMD3_ARATH|nr:hypothetical protein [Arabidopsis thaliana]
MVEHEQLTQVCILTMSCSEAPLGFLFSIWLHILLAWRQQKESLSFEFVKIFLVLVDYERSQILQLWLDQHVYGVRKCYMIL